MADGYGAIGTDDQAAAFALGLCDVVQLAVIHQVAAVHGVNHSWIVAQGHAHQWHQPVVRLAEAGRLGQHHHIALIAYGLEIRQWYGVCHAAIQQLAPAEFNDPRGQGHRCRGTDPVVGLLGGLVQLPVDGLSGQDVRTHHDEGHGVGIEGSIVEHVETAGHGVVAELRIKIVAGGEPRAQSAVAAVAREARIIAYGASGLSRLDVASEGCSRRDTYQSVGPDIMLHHHVGDARRPQSAHGSTLKYETPFSAFYHAHSEKNT